MIRFALSAKILSCLEALQSAGKLPAGVAWGEPEVSPPKVAEHGDYATNIAMVAAGRAGMNPRAFGELLATELEKDEAIAEVAIAGPGFINLRLKPDWMAGFVEEILAAGESFGNVVAESPQRINVEFVSVNPNGPITIGSGRGAAYGSTLCNVLEAAGNTVHREYYINDGVNSEQMRLFAESVRSYVEKTPFPEKGYRGDYVEEVAKKLQPGADYRAESERLMIEAQREALTLFGVEFDTWFSEQSIHDDGSVAKNVDDLIRLGVADEEPYRTTLKMAGGGKIAEVVKEIQEAPVDDEGNPLETAGESQTLWLRSTKFGDDMDRVLRRRDGRLTYIASDVAYHKDKFNRPANADKLITVLGPDHHGYIARLTAVVGSMLKKDAVGVADEFSEIDAQLYTSPEEKASCLAALEEAKKKLKVQIFQLVRFMKDGKPAPMRKRDGNIYALRDLMAEVGQLMIPEAPMEEQLRRGADVARFFYLMRSHDTTFDFDLDVASKQSDDNPVFYVQYAHARICSLVARAEAEGVSRTQADFSRLVHPREVELIKMVSDLPYEVKRCAEDFAIHRIATYAITLSRAYHAFYDSCRVLIADDPGLAGARLALCQAARLALFRALHLLGVSAPERLDRAKEAPVV